MLRHLFVLFFILTNLTGQVSAAYSCAMTGGAPVVLKHCCCDSDAKAPASDESDGAPGCCKKMVEVAGSAGDQVAELQANVKVPQFDPQALPALLPALFAMLVPPTSHEAEWEPSETHGLYGTDLYLRTQRLRL